jgi:hypothetical protein
MISWIALQVPNQEGLGPIPYCPELTETIVADCNYGEECHNLPHDGMHITDSFQDIFSGVTSSKRITSYQLLLFSRRSLERKFSAPSATKPSPLNTIDIPFPLSPVLNHIPIHSSPTTVGTVECQALQALGTLHEWQ